MDSSMLRGSRLRIPGGQDATRNSNSATTSETPLEQRLRDRDASNRLLVERDSLKEQLKEVSNVLLLTPGWVGENPASFVPHRLGQPKMPSKMSWKWSAAH